MADPHSLAIGDTVTHPDWPAGETRRVLGFSLFRRIAFDGKRRKLVDDPNCRVVHLDRAVPIAGSCESDDAWMEAGLVAVP